MNHGLLVLGLIEWELVPAVFLKCLAQASHISMAEYSEDAMNQSMFDSIS